MRLRTRIAVVAAVAASSAGLFAAPAQAATLISSFPPSEYGRLFCQSVEGNFEAWKAEAEGHSGDWYYCEQTPSGWYLYER
ncbi:hypothetical protein ACIBF6_45230 [Streptosporangium amethystogenes]|uniref:hypothetical protein n=1 Tax=Streptosporangium amethystogenes TaxID=2002 RepID=UPI00361AA493